MNNGKKMTARLICLLLGCILVMTMLPACGDTGDTSEDETEYTEDVGDLSDSQGTVDQAYVEEQSVDVSSLAGEDGIDVDLTALSATMIYSVVNDMMVRPEEYVDKVVRMSGYMSVYYDDETKNTYYACIIQDATACCSQGIEFKTTDGRYPKEDEDVTVTGTFGLYDEDGVQYCILNDAVVES